MNVKDTVASIARRIEKIVSEIDVDEIEVMIEQLLGAERVFLMGAGRSGLVSKAFATRLAQLGFTAYVVGESTTPAMTSKDVLLVVSGSGETRTVVVGARLAKKVGARIITVTSYPRSRLGKLSNHVVVVKGRTKIDLKKDPIKSQILGGYSSLTPLGTLFEDTVMIFFDGVVAKLMSKRNLKEIDLRRRHCVVE